jgi:hypothetical protein
MTYDEYKLSYPPEYDEEIENDYYFESEDLREKNELFN